MGVRIFRKTDISQVVKLYWDYLVSRSGQVPTELQDTFADLYFNSPWVRDHSPSFIYEDNKGEVLGFIGVITRKMSLGGEFLRVGFAGNFVVHPKARSLLAASQLLAAMLSGDQDMLCTDSANDISRRVLERVGFRLIPSLNIHWARPLQPSSYVVHAIFRGLGPGAGLPFHLIGKAVAKLMDSAVGAKLNPLPAATSDLYAEDLSSKTLLHCLGKFNHGQKLQTVYDCESLQWLLNFMERNRKRGTLRKVLLRDKNHNIVGWYIYYVKPGNVGEVVHIGAAQALSSGLITAMLRDASRHGLIALHGLAGSDDMASFSDVGCFFTCRGGWTLAQSRRPELMNLLLQGKTAFSRLDGEWCLNPGE
jgi:Acetyltransferase (GNAT) family